MGKYYQKNKEKLAEYQKKYRLKNRARLKQARILKQPATTARVKAQRDRLRKYVRDYLAKSQCADCGNSRMIVLEFDHLRDKVNDIAVMTRRAVSISTLKTEISKCQVLCGNCHAKKTKKVHGSRQIKPGTQLFIKNQIVVSFLSETACVDCGQSDVDVLEFDHLKNKKDKVSYLRGSGASVQRLVEEIKKCVIRCRNCHKIKTSLQRPCHRMTHQVSD